MQPRFVAGGVGVLSLVFAGGLNLGHVLAQSSGPAAPTQNAGVTVNKTVAMDLGPEIPGMAGRQLRLRVITVAPGGMFAVHNHRDRPTVEFVLSGTAAEFRGDAQNVVREGDAVLSDKDTTHWWRNDGNTPVVFVAADVFHPQ